MKTQSEKAAAFRALHERPGAFVIPNPSTIAQLVSSVGKPVNVVTHFDPSVTLEQVARTGAKRISVGGALSRLALAAFLKGAREMKEKGGFAWLRDTVPSKELQAVFTSGVARRYPGKILTLE